jgi:predicted O-methyltransferase YrrM
MFRNELLNILNSVERQSDKMFIPRIGRDDGIAIYVSLYIYASNRSSVVAIDAGAGIGYSTLWISIPLEELCIDSHIYAVERDRYRYEILKRNIASFPRKCIDVVPIYGDAVEYIKSNFSSNSIDFIFIDIDKYLYGVIFDVVKNKMVRGGIIAFHNAYMVSDVVAEIVKDAIDLGWKSTVIPTEEGILMLKVT